MDRFSARQSAWWERWQWCSMVLACSMWLAGCKASIKHALQYMYLISERDAQYKPKVVELCRIIHHRVLERQAASSPFAYKYACVTKTNPAG
jgi:hypothetical protein